MNTSDNRFVKCLLCLMIWTSLLQANAQNHPIMLITISDDHAYEAIRAYRNKFIQTPNIDLIANEGLLFQKAYVTNSLCAPSGATLLTFYRGNRWVHFVSSQNGFI